MCNFELTPDQFRQRRLEMIALADERRLAKALRPVRAERPRARRRVPVPLSRPIGLRPATVPR